MISSDYATLLFSHNLTGTGGTQAKTIQIVPSLTAPLQDSNDRYQITYSFLDNQSDLLYTQNYDEEDTEYDFFASEQNTAVGLVRLKSEFE